MAGPGTPSTAATAVRKASSLLELKKRIAPITAMKPKLHHAQSLEQHKLAVPPLQGQYGSITSLSSNNSTAADTSAFSAWSRLTGTSASSNATVTHDDAASSNQVSPTSINTPSVAESVGVEAFLRIRPANAGSDSGLVPNIQVLSPHEATMSAMGDPASVNMPRSTSLASLSQAPLTPNIPTSYSFSGILQETSTQKDVFDRTTLPLVRNLIGANESDRMDNALVFAYGVSGGGKTHTVQGSTAGGAGLLPRALDIILNSIGDRQTASNLRPSRLTALELTPRNERTQPGNVMSSVSFDSTTVRKTMLSEQNLIRDDTVLDVGDKYEYSVWASYAEVYNEKIYDLFDAVEKRKALSLKSDRGNGQKYISGLKELRIRIHEDAKALLQHGQVNRHVFSTKQNAESSRSHSIFTIRVLRLPKGTVPEEQTPAFANMARLSIVDLAGSERYKNTLTKGDRIKEAGNINKSLMVLSQCMEVMRKNQEDALRGKKPTIVPFRHSKLTVLFQSFFTGDGKAVLIAAINPYQTSYEENLSVLRFAAVARQVATTRSTTTVNAARIAPASHTPHYQLPLRSGYHNASLRTGSPVLPSLPEGDATFASSHMDEAEFESAHETTEDYGDVLKTTGRDDADSDSDVESEDAFVEELLNQIRHLRRTIVQLELEREAAVFSAGQEAEDRAESEIQAIERKHAEQRRIENERFEDRMDKKINILTKMHAAQMQALEARHQDEMEKMRTQYERQLRLARQQQDAEVSDEENPTELPQNIQKSAQIKVAQTAPLRRSTRASMAAVQPTKSNNAQEQARAQSDDEDENDDVSNFIALDHEKGIKSTKKVLRGQAGRNPDPATASDALETPYRAKFTRSTSRML